MRRIERTVQQQHQQRQLMAEALQFVIEMNEWTWDHCKDALKDVSREEIDWRPLPQANSINLILRHLRIEA
jgi:hypothetical protein